jgi:glycosyltransferase involved in cell wall biosynthesis
MLKNKTIAVVVPCYNEEQQIGMVIETMPGFVDKIVVVNDRSTDRTAEVVAGYFNHYPAFHLPARDYNSSEGSDNLYLTANQIVDQMNREEIRFFTPAETVNEKPGHDRVILINHLENGGVGAAIATGYKWCKDHDIDCTAVMAGDGQMDPAELESICMPVVEEGIDYVKGNRLIHPSSRLLIPKTRFFGNSVLSILTKVASGYWHVSDTQTGYTAISGNALNAIRLYKIYKRYGMPNDMLVKLNIAFCTIREVGIKPVYHVGEKSKMKVGKVIFPIMWLLFKSFFRRMWIKYLFRNFHPLFLLYHLGIFLLLAAIPFFVDIMLNAFRIGEATPFQTMIIFIFLIISGSQSLFFAMWMDIQDNDRLDKG